MNAVWRRNIFFRRATAPGIFLLAFCTLATGLFAADDPKTWTVGQQEQFLNTAKITKTYTVKKGVTGTVRVTLSDGGISHDASVQTINEEKRMFQPDNGPPELNFHDTFKYNIAAWKLAKVLGLTDMMPPSVNRRYKGEDASFTWWIDDVMMDEGDRKSKKLDPPDLEAWNREMNTMLVFDQLIYNMDRNVGNIVIDKGWHIWMIDHTRGFRAYKTLRTPSVLSFCDRDLLAKMKTLEEAPLRKEMEPYVGRAEIQGLLARRDLIVKFFDAKGASFIFDRPTRN